MLTYEELEAQNEELRRQLETAINIQLYKEYNEQKEPLLNGTQQKELEENLKEYFTNDKVSALEDY